MSIMEHALRRAIYLAITVERRLSEDSDRSPFRDSLLFDAFREFQVLFPPLGIELDWSWERKMRALRLLQLELERKEQCQRWQEWLDELDRW